MGLLILPGAFISVALSITLFSYTIIRGIFNSIDWFFNLSSVGFDFYPLLVRNSLDNTLIDFNPLRLLAVFSLFLGLAMVLISKKYSKEDCKVGFSYFVYIIVYWLLFAFWWIVAINIKLFKRKIAW